MIKTLREKPKFMEESIVNWSAVSQLLAKNSDSIRQNRIPKMYEEKINLLLHYIKCWNEDKELITPLDFEEKVKSIDLFSAIMEQKLIKH